MSYIFEGRPSDSPYVQHVWRGHVVADYNPVCPADMNWNLLFTREHGKVRVTAEGATTSHVPKTQFAGREFLVIKFALGVYMPYITPDRFVDSDLYLPNASDNRFWLDGDSHQFPDYDNVETFVDWLVRDGVVVVDPLVTSPHQQADVSSRTIRRHYRNATGITPKVVEQIERSKSAVALLQNGTPLLDVAYAMGYSDQAHMTRSIKRFFGKTPSEIIAGNAVNSDNNRTFDSDQF